MKKIIILLVLLVTLTGTGIFFLVRNNKLEYLPEETGKIKIMATLFPYYDIAKEIGKEKAEVSFLLPPGIDPHSFEPTPSDFLKINTFDIFIYTGDFMEPWADKILDSVSNNIYVIEAGKGIDLIEGDHHHNGHHYDEHHTEDHHHNGHHTEDHHHNGHHTEDRHHNGHHHDEHHHNGHYHEKDPHIWLDFDNVKKIANDTAMAMITLSPEYESFFTENLNSYIEKIEKLDKKFKESLEKCKTREIIYSGHYAFGYLANRYGLKHHALIGMSPDAEPTISSLISVIEKIKRDNINYVFYEEMVSPKVAQIIKEETGAKMLSLNPAENLPIEDFEKGVSFLEIMEKNLENLKIGLECE